MDIENPFVQYNNSTNTEVQIIPNFERTERRVVRLSKEAYIHLNLLSVKFTGKSHNLTELLEQIGLGALCIEKPRTIVDEESNISTDECRQSGYLDGLHGDSSIFLQLYGKLNSQFQTAYLRGFFEGNYIRNKDKR